MKRLTLILFLSLFANSVWAATWYVRSSENCPNNGNGSAPTCAAGTGQAGAIRNHNNTQGATFAAGDTVYICDVLPSASSPQWNSTIESGDAGNPIVFDGNCPMGDGTYRQGGYDALGTTTNAFQIVTTSPNYVTWRNLILKRGAADCANINVAAATGLRFENITVEDCGVDGFDVDNAAVGGVNVDGMTVRRAATTAIACNNARGGTWKNLRVEDSGTTGGNTDGVAINDGCGDGTIVEDVVVLRQKGGGGVDFQDSTGTGTLTARRLYIADGEKESGASGFTSVCNAGTQTIDASAVIAVNNHFNIYLKDCGGLHKLSHFVTRGANSTELKLGDSGTSGDVLAAQVNNSSFGGASCAAQVVYWRNDASVTITMNNNQYCPGGEFGLVSGGTVDFAGWKTASSQDAASISANPQFLGGSSPTTAEGFRPLPSSPLLGAGSPLGAKYDYEGYRFGNPPNIGAFVNNGPNSYSRRSNYDRRTTFPERY